MTELLCDFNSVSDSDSLHNFITADYFYVLSEEFDIAARHIVLRRKHSWFSDVIAVLCDSATGGYFPSR